MNKQEIRNVREQIQEDLMCLSDGFNVGNKTNREGQTFDELLCEIVCRHMKNLVDKVAE